jgi:hypothetical protein
MRINEIMYQFILILFIEYNKKKDAERVQYLHS